MPYQLLSSGYGYEVRERPAMHVQRSGINAATLKADPGSLDEVTLRTATGACSIDFHPSRGEVLFVAGCAANQGRFRTHMDHVVLLTAPVEVTLERPAAHTTNPFGEDPVERAKILADKAAFEPLLRQSADLELETTEPLEMTMQRLVDLINR